MENLKAFLREWLIRYLENRNLSFHTIDKITEKGDDVIVKYKDKEVIFFVRPYLSSFADFAGKKEQVSVVVFNSKENYEALIKDWNKIKGIKDYCIYFINPFSSTENKWIIVPYTHERISDSDSLVQGLKSMYETVEPLPQKEAERKIKAEHQ